MEEKLKSEYIKKRKIEESRVLKKIESDPSYFYKYSRKKSSNSLNIPSLKGPNGLVSDSKAKASILNKQYASVWLKPLKILSGDYILNIFGEFEMCSKQYTSVRMI